MALAGISASSILGATMLSSQSEEVYEGNTTRSVLSSVASVLPTTIPPATPKGDWPGPDNTGVPAGTVLRECARELTTPGAIYDGCRFSNGVKAAADNVTIRNSLIIGRVSAGYGTQQKGLMISDVEIDGQDPTGIREHAIGDSNYTCIRCNIHNTRGGARMGNNVRIEDSWIHDQFYVEGDHQTAVSSGGGSNFIVRHNNLDCGSHNSNAGCSSALSLYGDFAPIDDVLIERNLFNTKGSYCTYGGSVRGKTYPSGTNIRYIDNEFGRKYFGTCGRYGPLAAWDSSGLGNIWTGNVWADTQSPLVT